MCETTLSSVEKSVQGEEGFDLYMFQRQGVTPNIDCAVLWYLYTDLQKEGIVETAEIDNFAELVQYQVFLNAEEGSDYYNCNENEIISTSSSWCDDNFIKIPQFTAWDLNNEKSACQQAMDLTLKQYDQNPYANGCAMFWGSIFKSY